MVVQLNAGAKEHELECVCVFCETALPVVDSLHRSVKGCQQKNLKLLLQLSLAFRGATQPSEDGANLVHDIAETISSKN